MLRALPGLWCETTGPSGFLILSATGSQVVCSQDQALTTQLPWPRGPANRTGLLESQASRQRVLGGLWVEPCVEAGYAGRVEGQLPLPLPLYECWAHPCSSGFPSTG